MILPITLTLSSPASSMQLYLLEKSLFFSFFPVTWSYGQLRFLSGLSRGGGGVLYSGTYREIPTIIKLPPYRCLKTGNSHIIKEIESEYSTLHLLEHVEGVPDCFQKEVIPLHFRGTRFFEVPCLVLESAQGVSLGSLIYSDVAVEMKIEVFQKLTLLIDEVHRTGVVHKDINPENIILDLDPVEGVVRKVWLIDFGASSYSRRFSVQFGSPEQHMPLAYGEVGERSDIFSLALVMFAFFEKTLPFTEEKAIKSIAEDKELILNFHFCENRGIHCILERMLKKDPQDRYQKMRDVHKDLVKVAE